MAVRILFLDDDKIRHENLYKYVLSQMNCEVEAVIVETADKAMKELAENEFDIICLDHDLGGEQMVASTHVNSGYTVAKFLEEHCDNPPPIIVHSMNTVGIQNMMRALRNFRAYAAPFGTNMFHQTVQALTQEIANE